MLHSDKTLVNRYLVHGESFALEQLVYRHSEMVMKVCQNMLPSQDADDAFQATFLILVKKIKTIRERESIAGWLYEVATRTSLQVKQRRLRLRETAVNEKSLIDDSKPTNETVGSQESKIVLSEVNRLPRKYREVIVLRCFDQHSRRDAANLLNQTEAQVKGLLARGRNLLKKRLIRRGITPVAALAVLQSNFCFGASASASPALLSSTISICSVPLKKLVATQSIAAGNHATASASLATLGTVNSCLQQMAVASFVRAVSLAACILVCVSIPVSVIAQSGPQVSPALSPPKDSTQNWSAGDREKPDTLIERIAELAKAEARLAALGNKKPKYNKEETRELLSEGLVRSVNGSLRNLSGAMVEYQIASERLGEKHSFAVEKKEHVERQEYWLDKSFKAMARHFGQENPMVVEVKNRIAKLKQEKVKMDEVPRFNHPLSRVLIVLATEKHFLIDKFGLEHSKTTAVQNQLAALRFEPPIRSSASWENSQWNATKTIVGGPKIAAMANVKPRRPDLAEILPIKPSEFKNTSLQIGKQGPVSGFKLLNARAEILRHFIDTNGDDVPDVWMYFRDGKEVYRDIDEDFDQVVNRCVVRSGSIVTFLLYDPRDKPLREAKTAFAIAWEKSRSALSSFEDSQTLQNKGLLSVEQLTEMEELKNAADAELKSAQAELETLIETLECIF